MIIIIDYGLGNTRSIFAKFDQMDEKVLISSSISDIEQADSIVLPGVGSFNRGIENIIKMGIYDVLQDCILRKKIPTLGICLGMQLFSKSSEEGSGTGLGLFQADTIKFQFDKNLKLPVPHMGWNTIKIQRESEILNNIPDNSRFYFVHSFHLVCRDHSDILATTHYGYDYPSIIQKNNIIGVQFHPEKSHKQGIQLLKNFARS